MLYLGEYGRLNKVSDTFNTLGNLRIELSSCRQRVAGRIDEYYAGEGKAWVQLIEQQLSTLQISGELPDALKSYPEIGLLALQSEIADLQGSPSAAELAKKFEARIPAPITDDLRADWALWPSTRIPSKVIEAMQRR